MAERGCGRGNSDAPLLVSALSGLTGDAERQPVRSETPESCSPASLIDLLHALQSLKNLPRTGWRLRGIADGESVADHCFRMAFAAMLLADVLRARGTEIDVERTIRMALLHELAECTLGDIPQPAFEHLGAATKSQAEKTAVEQLLAPIGGIRSMYGGLWDEYEAGDTPESTVVRMADKMEMLLQALEYESVGVSGLDDFWDNVARDASLVETPMFRELLSELERRRPPQPHAEA